VAEPSLDLIQAMLQRVLDGQREMRAEMTAFRDDVRVLTAIVLRHENTLIDMLGQIRVMVQQHARFNDRLRALEEQP
jgi:hypothetical protein